MYTIKSLDQAIAAIMGEDIHNALMEQHSGRVKCLKMAAEIAFLTKADNKNTNIIRAALLDLNKNGYFTSK